VEEQVQFNLYIAEIFRVGLANFFLLWYFFLKYF